MPYITSVEQIGYDRGLEEKAIVIARCTGLSIAQIQTLQTRSSQ